MFGLELVVILGVAILASELVGRRVGIAPPILLLLCGVLLSFAPALRHARFPPELVLLVFLPLLLYWESLTTSLREIRANLRGIVLTSTLLVVATAAVVAATAHAFGVPWGPAWVLGAALAPTDATAVGALAGVLPRRNLTILRAESLINDGTALVIYGVAVGVTVGEQRLTSVHVTWSVVLAYGGGVLVGALVAALGAQVRRRITDPLLSNVAILLMPFTAYLLAELIDASGVLAVVVCGLTMSQVGPRIGHADARQQMNAFWSLSTHLLNASLFVLVGIEAQDAARSLTGIEPVTAIAAALALCGVILAVRLTFLVVSAYTIRLLDRRPAQRLRRVSNRARVVSTVAGFRGAVSLAAALAVPTTLASGAPFPDRDLIVFLTAGVVITTLVVQGLLLAPAARWARLPDDDRIIRERELADQVATEAALAATNDEADELGTDLDVVDRVREEYETHLHVLRARGSHDEESDPAVRYDQQYTALRLALLGHKRQALLGLRDEASIDDVVLRQVQARLDIEELRLSHAEPGQD